MDGESGRVIDEIGFNSKEKKLANQYLEELKGVSLAKDTLKINMKKLNL